MASTYSPKLRIEEPATGEKTNQWGTIVNSNMELIEDAICGYVSVAHDNAANYTLTALNGTADEARNMVLKITGTLTAARNVVCPTVEKVYLVHNATTGGYAVTIKTSGGTGISVGNGVKRLVYCDGTNVLDAITDLPSGATIDGATLVTLTGSQTLTNKTLTAPIISTISNTGTLTLPTSTDTMVGRATTDTLTNKTLTTPVLANPSFSGTTSNAGTITTVDINGGTIDGAAIGGSSPAAGSFTTIAGSGDVTIDTNVLKVDTSNDRVGIGTASPSKQLHITKSAVADWSAVSYGATITLDFSSAQNFSVTLTGNTDFANPTNITAGMTGHLVITQDGTGSRTATWGSYWKWRGGTKPTLTTTAGAVDRVDFLVVSATSIHASFSGNMS